jgi:DNA-binding MarR family transcriptional regulator
MKSRRALPQDGRKAAGGNMFDLSSFLPYRLAVAAAAVSRDFAAIYRAEFGLSVPEWRILAHLSQAGPVSVRDIHARVDMDKPKVSRAAARLQRRGYVAKVDGTEDRRLVSLSLTPAGRRLVAKIVPEARRFQARLEARLGDRLAAFADALESLSAKR